MSSKTKEMFSTAIRNDKVIITCDGIVFDVPIEIVEDEPDGIFWIVNDNGMAYEMRREKECS